MKRSKAAKSPINDHPWKTFAKPQFRVSASIVTVLWHFVEELKGFVSLKIYSRVAENLRQRVHVVVFKTEHLRDNGSKDV